GRGRGGGGGGGGDDRRWQRLQRKEQAVAELTEYLRGWRHEQQTLERWLRRPETTWEQLCGLAPGLAGRAAGLPAEAGEQGVLETKYSGYIAPQAAQGEGFPRLAARPIPAPFHHPPPPPPPPPPT